MMEAVPVKGDEGTRALSRHQMTQQEGNCLQTKKTALTRNQISQPPGPRLPAFAELPSRAVWLERIPEEPQGLSNKTPHTHIQRQV